MGAVDHLSSYRMDVPLTSVIAGDRDRGLSPATNEKQKVSITKRKKHSQKTLPDGSSYDRSGYDSIYDDRHRQLQQQQPQFMILKQ